MMLWFHSSKSIVQLSSEQTKKSCYYMILMTAKGCDRICRIFQTMKMKMLSFEYMRSGFCINLSENWSKYWLQHWLCFSAPWNLICWSWSLFHKTCWKMVDPLMYAILSNSVSEKIEVSRKFGRFLGGQNSRLTTRTKKNFSRHQFCMSNLARNVFYVNKKYCTRVDWHVGIAFSSSFHFRSCQRPSCLDIPGDRFLNFLLFFHNLCKSSCSLCNTDDFCIICSSRLSGQLFSDSRKNVLISRRSGFSYICVRWMRRFL